MTGDAESSGRAIGDVVPGELAEQEEPVEQCDRGLRF
jgi:hypothetical protein